MKDYSNWYPTRDERLKHKAIKNFELHYEHGDEKGLAKVNGVFEKHTIIKAHTNPMNFALEDQKMYFVNDENMIYRGDIVSGISGDGYNYIVVTTPESNGVTSKCRVRKMYDVMTFVKNGEVYTFDCVVAKGLLYDSTSYVTETKVFAEEDLRALIVQYNNITSLLRLFEPVVVNGEYYKIAKIDPYRLKEHPENHGVLQLVLTKCIAAVDETGNNMVTETLIDHRFGVEPFKISGILRYAKLKERIYNSKAREILTPHNVLKPGDYIEATFLRNPEVDNSTETRMYLTQSLVDMRETYDSAFLIDCNAQFNLKADNGDAHTVYAYFEINATQLMANERNSNVFNESSKYKCLVQSNPYTEKLGKEISRIMIMGDCYTVVGIDRLTAEGIIGVEIVEGKVNPSLDNFELQIADYYKTDDIIDITSDDEFDVIYENTADWTYLTGSEQILLGESAEFNVKYEQKILDSENPKITPVKTEFELINEDGTEVNLSDFQLTQENDKFTIKSAAKVSLLGKKMVLKSRVYFEEKIYNSDFDTYEIIERISEQIRNIDVSGW